MGLKEVEKIPPGTYIMKADEVEKMLNKIIKPRNIIFMIIVVLIVIKLELYITNGS
jgi:hypothetical protein